MAEDFVFASAIGAGVSKMASQTKGREGKREIGARAKELPTQLTLLRADGPGVLYFSACRLSGNSERGAKKTGGEQKKSPAGGEFIAERGSGGLRVNERIRAREVRVIDEAGNQLGVMSLFDAMKAARDAGLDVVEISPSAVPPVCKLVDYGKFLYEQNKKAHEQKKHQKSSHIKEVKFRPSTAEHDYQVRKNQIIRFLGDGFKVKAMIFHRGREMAHQDVGRAKMERLLKEIGEHAQVEFGPRMEANILLALLAPKKGAAAPAPSRPAQQQMA